MAVSAGIISYTYRCKLHRDESRRSFQLIIRLSNTSSSSISGHNSHTGCWIPCGHCYTMQFMVIPHSCSSSSSPHFITCHGTYLYMPLDLELSYPSCPLGNQKDMGCCARRPSLYPDIRSLDYLYAFHSSGGLWHCSTGHRFSRIDDPQSRPQRYFAVFRNEGHDNDEEHGTDQ